MFGREYRDLADLLLNNERAKHFYKSLPQDTQQILTENGSEIRTMTALPRLAAFFLVLGKLFFIKAHQLCAVIIENILYLFL